MGKDEEIDEIYELCQRVNDKSLDPRFLCFLFVYLSGSQLLLAFSVNWFKGL